jgi:hypothetical protein
MSCLAEADLGNMNISTIMKPRKYAPFQPFRPISWCCGVVCAHDIHIMKTTTEEPVAAVACFANRTGRATMDE